MRAICRQGAFGEAPAIHDHTNPVTLKTQYLIRVTYASVALTRLITNSSGG